MTDTTNARRPAVVLAAGEGIDASRRNGREVTLKATSAHTAGAFALHEASHPAGVPGPPAHRHPHSDEAFYVLSGQMRVLAGDTEHLVSAGAFVLIPAGMAHTFVTASDEPARFLALHTPGGFEGFFLDVANAERHRDTELAPAEMHPIASNYDWEIAGPPLSIKA